MKITRRQFIRSAAVAGTGCLVSAGMPSQLSAQMSRSQMNPDYKARGGPVRHSVMGWCFNPMPTSALIRHGKAMGLEGIEGISQSSYKEAMDAGLKISLVSGGHGFREGPCNPKFQTKLCKDCVDPLKPHRILAPKMSSHLQGCVMRAWMTKPRLSAAWRHGRKCCHWQSPRELP